MKIEIEKEITINGNKYWIKIDDSCVELYNSEKDAINKFNEYVEFYKNNQCLKKKEIIKSIEI